MGHRFYDDTPSRGSRTADPSIDAWFRELRGDAAPTEVRSAAAASRQRQRELQANPGGWHRGGDEPRRPTPAPVPAAPTESWSVDTRTWSPDWDTNATSYMPRPAASSPREGVPMGRPRDRRATGDHPRVTDRRATGDQPRIPDRRPDPGPPIDRRPTGEQARITDRRPTGEQARITDWRPAEPRAIEARVPEGRSAEIRDLNEARELREARAGRPARPAPVPPTTNGGGYARDSYDTTYDDLMAQSLPPAPAPSPSRSRTPAAALAPPEAPIIPSPPAPSPAPAYVPAPAAAAYAPAALGTPAYRQSTYTSGTDHRSHAAPSSPGSTYAPTEYVPSLTPYTQGSLATAPSYAEPSYAEPSYAEPSYDTPQRNAGRHSTATENAGTRLPEQRHADSQFDVVLPDSAGSPALGFKNGQWFRLAAGGVTSSPITVRSAVLDHADLAGSVVQIVCWWMRENSRRERALDIATELALAVTELTHMAELRKKSPAFY